MTDTTLTPFEIKVLKTLRDDGPASHTSAVGYRLWPESKKSPQGMALAAGRFLGPLRQRGLVGDDCPGWRITRDGLHALYSIDLGGD